ncbi:MAG TPA: hypothetical protein VFV28_04545 [Limnobacter sp.]|nr:hypothetical protein [Limnobacter sp.]
MEISPIRVMTPSSRERPFRLDRTIQQPTSPEDLLINMGLSVEEAQEVANNLKFVGGYTDEDALELIQSDGFDPSEWTNEGLITSKLQPVLA